LLLCTSNCLVLSLVVFCGKINKIGIKKIEILFFAAFNERKLGFEIDPIQGVGNKWKSWSVSVVRLSDTWRILLNVLVFLVPQTPVTF